MSDSDKLEASKPVDTQEPKPEESKIQATTPHEASKDSEPAASTAAATTPQPAAQPSSSPPEPTTSAPPPSLFNSWLGSATSLWDTVRTNPHVQQIQTQAQEALAKVDAEKVQQRLEELRQSAGTYLTETEKKLEEYENGALGFLQETGHELAQMIREGNFPQDPENLSSESAKVSVSRLDSDLYTLHTNAAKLLSKTDAKAVTISPEECDQYLENKDLKDLYTQVVPSKLEVTEFWNRYLALRKDIEMQDQRRKQIIDAQNVDEELDDWGSTEDEA